MEVPARRLPVPAFLSPEAQATFGPLIAWPPMPAPDDVAGWKRYVADRDAAMAAALPEVPGAADHAQSRLRAGAANVFVLRPPGLAQDDRRVFLNLHGGALVFGGGDITRRMGLMMAAVLGVETWALDYRMPPDHPYPAALDDCLAAYRLLLEDRAPGEIIVGGASAGGNLAAALVLRARDEGLPLPAAAILQTPEADLTESGDSFATLMGVDRGLSSLMPVNRLYANGADLAHPYLSPLFGDFAPGFPPSFLSTGTRDLYLSNTVRLHAALRAADVPADLHVLDGASHMGFPRSPEVAALQRQMRRFAEAHWQA
ncbi:alpha/beta hydrolase [Novosphingobium bradum]|uniref:Alpha/beta hydrolase n=1 Tax=Novosphingobium bradum TaxID=1737444 RepID=A0ABV7IL15_9SPHN